MHTSSQLGVTLRDSRIFSRGIALAAVAVLCVSATTARAAVLNFAVDPAQSSITLTSDLLIGKTHYSTAPVWPGSDTTSYSGTIKADVNPGTISFVSGSNVVADVSASLVSVEPPEISHRSTRCPVIRRDLPR